MSHGQFRRKLRGWKLLATCVLAATLCEKQRARNRLPDNAGDDFMSFSMILAVPFPFEPHVRDPLKQKEQKEQKEQQLSSGCAPPHRPPKTARACRCCKHLSNSGQPTPFM